MKCVVIIPAAGSGVRFGGQIPKQYLLLRGRPLILHTIERFLAQPRVASVVVAAAADQFPHLEAMLSANQRESVSLVEGGATRAESVRNALVAAEQAGTALVAVHDAVRPFFSGSTFERLLDEASSEGGAISVLPIVETVHRVDDSRIVRTEDRSSLVRAQTPQCFRLEVLLRAFRNFEDDLATDEAGMVTRSGGVVSVVAGDRQNIKITTPDDLALAEKNFDEWSAM